MEEITCTIAEAKTSAIERTKSCGMYISSYDDFYLIDGKLKFIDIAANQDGEKEFELDLDAETNVTIDKDVQDDINKITLIKSRTFTFPTYTPSIPSNLNILKKNISSKIKTTVSL